MSRAEKAGNFGVMEATGAGTQKGSLGHYIVKGLPKRDLEQERWICCF